MHLRVATAGGRLRSVGLLLLLSGLIGLLASGSCRAQVPDDSLRQKYLAIHSALAAHFDQFCCSLKDRDPDALRLLADEGALLRQWTLAYLSTNPNPAPSDFRAALRRLTAQQAGGEATGDIAGLGASIYVVTLDHYPIAEAFIVATEAGRLQVAWTIKDAVEAHGTRARLSPYLRRWLRTDGRQVAGARVGSLPDMADGGRRFYIDASYAQAAGYRTSNQISIWKWDGNRATPLYMANYPSSINFETDVTHFDGRDLHFYVLESYRMFWQGGGGRELDWRLRPTPTGVEDTGKQDIVPELALVDRIMSRFAHHRRASDLAAPAAADRLKAVYDEITRSTPMREDAMLGEYDVRRVEDGFCLTIDSDAAAPPDGATTSWSLQLVFTRVRGRLFLSEAADGSSCHRS